MNFYTYTIKINFHTKNSGENYAFVESNVIKILQNFLDSLIQDVIIIICLSKTNYTL